MNTKWLSKYHMKIFLSWRKNCSLGEMIQNLTSENIIFLMVLLLLLRMTHF